MKTYLTAYFGTVLTAVFLVPVVLRLAKWLQLVDAPDPRKVHKNPIPRVGGIAIVLSTLALVLPAFFLSNRICQMKTSTLVGLAIPFLALGTPILDTGFVIASRRIIERRSMFAPDRGHLHHHLLDLGLNHHTAVIVIYAITVIFVSIGVFMLTTDGKWSIGLLVGGLLLLFSTFACLHSGRFGRRWKGLKHNWATVRQTRAEKRSLEHAQVRMRESRSLDEWWKTVCDMAGQMHFKSIGLWHRRYSDYVNICS